MAAKEPYPTVPQWLKTLPVAPEYHPTLAEFQDPISYIYKIEKEASQYGICKIVPPLSQAPKSTAISNLNRSLAAARSVDSKTPAKFTTVKQQIGIYSDKSRPAEKLVWQSGENYTLMEFKAKAKQFENTQLRNTRKKVFSRLEIETLYWKACGGERFSVEYANDIPGSAFVPINEKRLREAGEATVVGETAWNMRGVSRASGSLLRFMKEETPGVNTPMIYLAMLYGWSGWHVEDHDLHSLNYIHMGAAKTWYGVPKEGAAAFEEVVRVHGYGGEVNPLVTCAILTEKTTIMYPEVLINAGVPCCRLVQNAGEFVVTFPRAYHCGFSHGFSCGETVNITTPEWLKVAKEAAIRRASINRPPLMSHIQLLYALALALYSRIPLHISTEPRSSRLKEKKRGEGETTLKELFVQHVIQNNELLHELLEKGNCVLLSRDSSNIICSNESIGSKVKVNPRFSAGIGSPGKESEIHDTVSERENASRSMGILDYGTFPCVTCGVLCFGCAAVIQPTEEAAKYFKSADCSFFNNQIGGSEAPEDEYSDANWSVNTPDPNSLSGKVDKSNCDEAKKCISSLDLLANLYGHTSDSEDENIEHVTPKSADESHSTYNQRDRSGTAQKIIKSETCDRSSFRPLDSGNFDDEAKSIFRSSSSVGGKSEVASLVCNSPTSYHKNHGRAANDVNDRFEHNPEKLLQSEIGNKIHKESPCGPADCSMKSTTVNTVSNCSPPTFGKLTSCSNIGTSIKDAEFSSKQRGREDSFREHIFCLEHAVEIEEQLQSIGGAHVLLVCHPDYPGIETEAKALSKELRIKYLWKDISFREATKDDQAKIQSALDVKAGMNSNADWTVKLGINISYSARLGQASVNNSQMPNNSVVRKTFGYSSPTNSDMTSKVSRKRRTERNKIVVAGTWCGKAWMSNQVHPYLVQREYHSKEALVSFNMQATPHPNVKLESTPELSDDSEKPLVPKKKLLQSVTSTVGGKPETKRKGTLKRGTTTKKPKYAQPDSPVEDVEDAPLHNLPSRSCGMVLRNKRKKRDMSPFCCGLKKEDSSSESDTGNRKRPSKLQKTDNKLVSRKQTRKKVVKTSLNCKKFTSTKDEEGEQYKCDIDGCTMEFGTKQELLQHKRNICLVEGCGKKFFSHEYLDKHRRVHTDDRPLKCPWKGCNMSFKWAWARTEHIRVHTGERPYQCQEPGCGQTFRFITDFSRHRRKTGHNVRKKVGDD